MKLKVFFRTIGFPFLLAAFILWPPVDRLSVRLFLFIGISVWLLLRFVSNKRTYLSGLAFVNDTVKLQFITAQLTTKNLMLNVRDISGMKLSKVNFSYNYTGSLRIHAKEQWHTFLIIDRKMFDMAEQEANTVNTSLQL
jgi:hypothetical protein